MLAHQILTYRVVRSIVFGTDYYMTLQEATEIGLWQTCRTKLGPQRFHKIATLNTNHYLASRFFPDPANTRFGA